MKLDKRILEGKTYLDCYDTEIAKKFIGKECYLSDGVASFANVDNLNRAVLTEIDDEYYHPYKLENTRWKYASPFILPCEWVKEEKKEPKYRPYTKNEFLAMFEWGKPINIRHKDDGINVFIETLSSVKIDNYMDDVYVRLYERAFDLEELFNEFEWQKSNGEWQPFGILDE